MNTTGKGHIKQIHIRVKPDVYSRLEQIAEREHRTSVNDLMRVAALKLAEQEGAA